MVDLVGVGNLNTDTTVHVDYHVLEMVGISKGNDAGKKEFFELEKILKNHHKENSPGGSVANTIFGAHNLGMDCFLGGIIGSDELGREFFKGVQNAGIKNKIIRKDGRSANLFSMITPDKDRTFADNLGVANSYEKEDLPYEYIEPGCTFFTSLHALEGKGRHALLELIKYAKSKKAKTAFGLGSKRLVEIERDFLEGLVRDYIDLVFCNDSEAEALTGLKTDGAIDSMGDMCETVAITLGEEGVLIKNDGKYYRINGFPAKPVNKTGAGDAFCTGFFYGLKKTGDIEKAGRIGCYYASKVVECNGARLNIKIENIENQV
jgi:sugar/nucleoside kinase (ribokinase family)